MSSPLLLSEIDRTAVRLVSQSYNYDKNSNIIGNKQFIERQWLEEYEELGIENLVNDVSNIYIYYPQENIGYVFNDSSMIHILENFRIPEKKDNQYSYSLMNYLFGNDKKNELDKYWGFYFYIYTDKNIFYANGIKNNQDKYFTMIPILK